MNQKEPKRSNVTHNQQQRLTTNFPLPCSQPVRLYLFGYFEDEFNSFGIYKSSRQGINKSSYKGYYQTTRPLLQVAGSYFSKYLNLDASGTNRHAAPKQRYDRFPSVGDQIHVTPTFEHAWTNPWHPVIGVSYKFKDVLDVF